MVGRRSLEGGLRVCTVAKSGDEGKFVSVDPDTISMFPLKEGDPLEIDAESAEDLVDKLVESGIFPRTQAVSIAIRF